MTAMLVLCCVGTLLVAAGWRGGAEIDDDQEEGGEYIDAKMCAQSRQAAFQAYKVNWAAALAASVSSAVRDRPQPLRPARSTGSR
jgi:hypothetical protein